MDGGFLLLLVVIALAIVFDFINGFHDTANAIATVVATRVLTPLQAIAMAGILNFLGAVSGTAVAKTVGAGLVDTSLVTQTAVAAALIGAIVWNLLTWYYGIPSSSSHALIGGLVGAVWCHEVLASTAPGEALWGLLNSRGVTLALKALVLSPIFGLVGGFLLMVLLLWAVRPVRPTTVNRGFRALQLISAGFMAFAHGSNDAQKSMGIITMALAAYAAQRGDTSATLDVPLWVIASCATAMA